MSQDQDRDQDQDQDQDQGPTPTTRIKTSGPRSCTPSRLNDWGLEELAVRERIAGSLFGRAKPVRLGRYVIEHRVGRGGMGEVWLATDPRLGRRVALKTMRAEFGRAPESQAQLVREAQTLAALAHENIVAVHDVLELGERVVIVQEFVEGASLGQWVRKREPSTGDRLKVLEQCAAGLHAAHGEGVAHLDFKPANVLVRRNGQAVVADFGLARALGSDASGGGTREFAAPEQWAARDLSVRVDRRADQWSLAATICAAFGTWPLEATQTVASLEDDPRSLAIATAVAQCPLPRAQRRALLRALDPDPGQRFESVAAFSGAFFERPRARKRTRTVLGGLAASGVAGVGLSMALLGTPEVPCAGISAVTWLDGSWTVSQSQSFLEEVERTHPDWTAAARTGALRLDRQRNELADLWPEVCEVDTADSPFVSATRACAEQRRAELAELGAQLRSLDAEELTQAPDLALALESVSDCRLALGEEFGEASPERDAAREEAQRGLVRAAAQLRLGDRKGARTTLQGAREQAQTAKRPGLAARVDLERARMGVRDGDVAEGLALGERAFFDATSSGADLVAADIALRMGELNAVGKQSTAEAQRWLRHADALLVRLGGDARREAMVARFKGTASLEDDDIDRALSSYTLALAKLRSLERPEPLLEASFLIDRAIALERKGDWQATLATYAEVKPIILEGYGEQHPKFGALLNNMGSALQAAGRYEESIPLHEQALAVATARGLAVRQSSALTNLCFAHNSAGNPAAGITPCKNAAKLCIEIRGGLGPCTSATMALGNTLASLGDGPGALAAYQDTFDGYALRYKPSDPAMAWAWFSLADGHRAMGEWTQAESAYLRTLELGGDGSLAPADLADISFARAKVARGRDDAAGAKALASTAVQQYKDAQLPALALDVEAWAKGERAEAGATK